MKKIIILTLIITGFLFFGYRGVEAACDPTAMLNAVRNLAIYIPDTVKCGGDNSCYSQVFSTTTGPIDTGDCCGTLDVRVDGWFGLGGSYYWTNYIYFKLLKYTGTSFINEEAYMYLWDPGCVGCGAYDPGEYCNRGRLSMFPSFNVNREVSITFTLIYDPKTCYAEDNYAAVVDAIFTPQCVSDDSCLPNPNQQRTICKGNEAITYEYGKCGAGGCCMASIESNKQPCETSGWEDPWQYKCTDKYTVGKKWLDRGCRQENCQPLVLLVPDTCPYQGDWPLSGVQCYIPDPATQSNQVEFCRTYSGPDGAGGPCYCPASCYETPKYKIDEEDYRTGECRDCLGGGILTPTNVTTGEPDPDYEVSKCGSGKKCVTYTGCNIDWPYYKNDTIDEDCESTYGLLSKARFWTCQGAAPNADCGKNLEWLVAEECKDECVATGKQKCGTQNGKPAVQAEYKCSKCLVDEKKTVTASASVTINEPDPNLNISCLISPNPPTTGQSVTFSAVTSGSSTVDYYSWTGECFSTSSSCTTSFSDPGTHMVYLNVAYDGDKIKSTTWSVNVIAPGPELNVSCSASPSTTVPGQNVTFSCLISGGRAPYNYTWSGVCSGSGTGSTASCSKSFSNPGNYSATLTVSTGTGEAYCSRWTDWRTGQVCSGPVDLSFFCWGKDIYKLEIGSDWTCQTGPNNTAKCESGSANGLTQWQSCQGFCCKGGPKHYGAFGNITGTFPECYGGCPTGTTRACGDCGGTQTCDYSCNWGPCVGATCHTKCEGEQGNLTCESVDGPGEDECETDEDCEGGQNPPTVSGLTALPETYCTGIPGCGEISFQWTYQDQDGDSQSRFDMQVDDNSDFLSPEVNRTLSNLSNPSGSTNTQIVFVRTDDTSSGCDYITFDESYYVRVRVWDSTGLNSGWVPYDDPTDADGDGNRYTFLKDPHPWPSAEFIFQPSNPDLDQNVIFPDLSICYKKDKTPYACKAKNPNTDPPSDNQYTWTFGDGESSTIIGDTSHTYAATGIYHVTLNVCDPSLYDPLNPSDGCCQVSRDVPVGVNQGGAQEWKEIPPPF